MIAEISELTQNAVHVSVDLEMKASPKHLLEAHVKISKTMRAREAATLFVFQERRDKTLRNGNDKWFKTTTVSAGLLCKHVTTRSMELFGLRSEKIEHFTFETCVRDAPRVPTKQHVTLKTNTLLLICNSCCAALRCCCHRPRCPKVFLARRYVSTWMHHENG